MLTTESNAGPIGAFRRWVDGANDGRRAEKFEVLVVSAIDAKILFIKYNIFFYSEENLKCLLKIVKKGLDDHPNSIFYSVLK